MDEHNLHKADKRKNAKKQILHTVKRGATVMLKQSE